MSNIEKVNSEITNIVKFIHNDGEIKGFLEDIYLITLDVAGLYYIDNLDEIFPKIKKGDTLELFREKNNKYDKFAILVMYSGEKIGYVPRKQNIILANLMDAGKELYAVVEKACKSEGVYVGEVDQYIKFKIFLKE